MESRRYQIFDLWRRRFRVLNQYLVAPAIPAWLNIAGVSAAVLGGLVLALRAPSEQMMKWADVPSPLQRWSSRTQRWTRGLVRPRSGDPPGPAQ